MPLYQGYYPGEDIADEEGYDPDHVGKHRIEGAEEEAQMAEAQAA